MEKDPAADMRQTWDTCNEGEMNRIMNTFVDEGNPSEEQLMLLENITAAVISERLPLPTAVQTAAQLRQQFLTQAQVMNDIAIERLEHAEEYVVGSFLSSDMQRNGWSPHCSRGQGMPHKPNCSAPMCYNGCRTTMCSSTYAVQRSL